MAEFLSDAWLAELDAAARAADDLGTEEPLVVETVVRGDDGELGYQLCFGPAGASIGRARELDADVVFVTDLATAWALHEGAVRAQDAFARGDLKVRGRPELLAGRAELFARVERAFAPVRAGTTAAPDR